MIKGNIAWNGRKRGELIAHTFEPFLEFINVPATFDWFITICGTNLIQAGVERIFSRGRLPIRIEEFLIQAITRGSDDMGKVHMQVEHKNVVYYGFSASTDIITASVEAFIDAMSQIV